MKHTLSKSFINTQALSLEMDGQTFDLEVIFTTLGEVLEIKNHFFKLLISAQQLILENKYEVLLNKLITSALLTLK